MSRAVIATTNGGPEVLEVRQVEEPHAGPNEVRVKVSHAGLNPMDWLLIADKSLGAAFGVTTPAGFGYDLAGVVDEVGSGVPGFKVGDRVFGGAMSRAVAEYAVIDPARDELMPTPAGLDDATASTLAVAARTAVAALDAAGVSSDDTILVGGASGGVGIFAVQLARLRGARVIGTSSEASFDLVRDLGALPVQYGDGLADRVRSVAPDGITAAVDLYGTETAMVALHLGVPAERISTIAAGDSGLGVKATGGVDAPKEVLHEVAELAADGRVTVPVAAQFPLERVREAVELQATRHARGKIVVVI